jgi:hypothetical protein
LNPIDPGLVISVGFSCCTVEFKVSLRVVEVKTSAFNKGRDLLKLFVGIARIELNDSVENFR